MFASDLFVNYLIYFGVSIVLLALGVLVFIFTTKSREFNLIAKGNKAAGIVVAGRTLGLAIVLYSAIANSISLIDLIIWAVIGMVTQVAADYLAEILTPSFNVAEALEKDNVAVAIALFGMFVSIGLIVAGCLTY